MEDGCQQLLFAVISHQGLKTLWVPNQQGVNALLRALRSRNGAISVGTDEEHPQDTKAPCGESSN